MFAKFATLGINYHEQPGTSAPKATIMIPATDLSGLRTLPDDVYLLYTLNGGFLATIADSGSAEDHGVLLARLENSPPG